MVRRKASVKLLNKYSTDNQAEIGDIKK